METLALLAARNNGCVFTSQLLTAISLPFNSCPQKPQSKYLWFYTGVAHSHTHFSCDLPSHDRGDPKKGLGKERSSSLRAVREMAQPQLVSFHIMQAIEPPQRTSWGASSFLWESYFALTCPMPHEIVKSLPFPKALSSPSDATPGSASHLPARLLH